MQLDSFLYFGRPAHENKVNYMLKKKLFSIVFSILCVFIFLIHNALDSIYSVVFMYI